MKTESAIPAARHLLRELAGVGELWIRKQPNGRWWVSFTPKRDKSGAWWWALKPTLVEALADCREVAAQAGVLPIKTDLQRERRTA